MAKWDELSFKDKSDMIRVAVQNGVSDLKDIRQKYNEFAEGGEMEIPPYTPGIDDYEAPEYRDYLKRMAINRERAFKEAYGHSPSANEFYNSFITNDNGTFNYRRWYNLASPEEREWGLKKGLAHWTDASGKTSLHPTFSIESPYSGYINPYNPKGIVGGTWLNTGDPHNERYEFSDSQMDNEWPINKTLEEFQWAREHEDTNPYAMYKGGYVLPEIFFYGNKHSDGGSIHIKPENRGKFTRLKERTGHSATWFKEHGTPAQKRMAVFALNSRHWNKHALGGYLKGEIYDLPEEEIMKLINAGYEIEYL